IWSPPKYRAWCDTPTGETPHDSLAGGTRERYALAASGSPDAPSDGRLADDRLDPVGLGGVRHLPAVEEPLDDRGRNPGFAIPVLLAEDGFRDFQVHDADGGLVGGEQVDHLGPQEAAEVGRVPGQGMAGTEVVAGQGAGAGNDGPLLAGRVDVQF